MKDAHKSRIAEGFRSGKPWELHDLLMGLKGSYGYDQELYESIGELFHDCGNLPRAGLYWAMTLRDGPEVDSAISSAIRTFGPRIVDRLPLPGDVSYVQMPEEVVDRVAQVLERAGLSDGRTLIAKRWPERAPVNEQQASAKENSCLIGCAIIVLFIIAVFCCGIYFILSQIWRMV